MTPGIPPQYLRRGEAAPARTLVDIFHDTATGYPDAAAIDDGTILTYAELREQVLEQAKFLHSQGIKRGDRIGIRLPSGHRELYIAILATLHAGAAYVPVDADDPPERAELVFSEANINGLFDATGYHPLRRTPGGDTRLPRTTNDAWIIFTSGSTGKPKGVAVSHRCAAAFVDAEAQLFLQDAPLGPDDRVLAGLSVAFDASCEEMWLAWAHGACLVPAPRALVRSGLDLGPWLIRRDITVVSTVPTLAGMWPAEALDAIRLLILGGEACSPELAEKLLTPEREVWNTYGPTEATVVACASELSPGTEVSIGLPLAGWDLAVVDPHGHPVAEGEVGELIIGGIGLARYLDEEKDKEKYAPMPTLGWARAYRSGDHVRLESDGLYFVGRVDDQVKIGGRRIELGEVEAHVAALPNVRSTSVLAQPLAGNKVLVAYLSLEDPEHPFDYDAAKEHLRAVMPQALVPKIHVLPDLPVTTSGKVDKRALPWPLPITTTKHSDLTPTETWLAELWQEVLAEQVHRDADFFELGGTSLAAATLIGRIRSKYPTIAVRDLYDHPRLGALAEHIETLNTTNQQVTTLTPVPRSTRIAQTILQIPVLTLQSSLWIALLLLANNLANTPWAHPISWWVLIPLLIIFATPMGRLPLGGFAARLVTWGIQPGTYPRGGRTHLRIWFAERLADASGSRSIAGATWVNNYARALGVRVGKGVDLHSLPPVTGLLTLKDHCAVEPEVDLSGYTLQGDKLIVGAISIGKNSRIGARSTLLPGTSIGDDVHIEAGSTVLGEKPVKKGARWSGSPARKVGRNKHRFPDTFPPRKKHWVMIYGLSSLALSALPLSALTVGVLVFLALGAWFIPLAALFSFATYMVEVFTLVRLLSRNLEPGVYPVHSSPAWRSWFVERLMDDARTYLFPLYAGQLTPLWLRALGATIGKDVEISTAVMVPRFVEVRDGAFLADDTLVGGYELGGGWMLTGRTRIGKRSFLGNSGIAGPNRRLSKDSLVAVLSSTPKKAKAGSNWWGSPPERMRRVNACTSEGNSHTYAPTFRLKFFRGLVETLRLAAPIVAASLGLGYLLGLQFLLSHLGLITTWLLSGLLLMFFGMIALLITVAVKWVCVGKHHPGNHPLFSWYVWLNELQDTFVETLAAPWFLTPNLGTGMLNIALRLLGVRVGRGAWIESYWFPETDLCHVGANANIGPGTVVQTHLFQDRIMSLDTVTIADGATLAAHSVVLPGAHIGAGTIIEPGSLVMRGDQIPPNTIWQGNPVEPRI